MRLVFVFFCFVFFSCSTSIPLVPGSAKKNRDALFQEYLSLGDEYASLEKYEKAVSFYEKALPSKTFYWTALYKLARTNALSKNWKKAKKYYTALLTRDSENVNLKTSLAYIEAMSGNFESAKKIYETLVSDETAPESIYTNYESVLLSMKKIDDAETLLSRIKEKFPASDKISDFEKKLTELKDEAAWLSDDASETEKTSEKSEVGESDENLSF